VQLAGRRSVGVTAIDIAGARSLHAHAGRVKAARGGRASHLHPGRSAAHAAKGHGTARMIAAHSLAPAFQETS